MTGEEDSHQVTRLLGAEGKTSARDELVTNSVRSHSEGGCRQVSRFPCHLLAEFNLKFESLRLASKDGVLPPAEASATTRRLKPASKDGVLPMVWTFVRPDVRASTPEASTPIAGA